MPMPIRFAFLLDPVTCLLTASYCHSFFTLCERPIVGVSVVFVVFVFVLKFHENLELIRI